MGSHCTILRRSKDKDEDEPYQKKFDCEEDSSLLERPPLRQKRGTVQSTTEKETERRQEQEEKTASDKLDCGEESRTLPHDGTMVKVKTQR